MRAGRLLAVVDVASAHARQLVDCRMAGSARTHMSAEEVGPGYVADGQLERGWSLCGEDVAEAAAAGAASDVVRFAKKVARCLAAGVKGLSGTAAWRRWAWAANFAACHVEHAGNLGGAACLAVAAAASSGDGPVYLSRPQRPPLRPRHPRRRLRRLYPRSPEGLCVRALRHNIGISRSSR